MVRNCPSALNNEEARGPLLAVAEPVIHKRERTGQIGGEFERHAASWDLGGRTGS